MNEIWKDIPDYEGWYSVSSIGRVRRERIGAGEGGDGTYKGRILIPTKGGGYLHVKLSKNGLIKRIQVHVLVLKAFVGPRPLNYLTNHKDGIKSNNFLSNLEWVTSSQNTKHAFSIGLITAPKGEEHYNAKLKDAQILSIRNDYIKGNITQRALAKKYNLDYRIINSIILKRIWKHI